MGGSADGGAEDAAKPIGDDCGTSANGELAKAPTKQRAAGEHAGGCPGGEQRDPDQDSGDHDRQQQFREGEKKVDQPRDDPIDDAAEIARGDAERRDLALASRATFLAAAAIPEPETWAMFAMGLGALGFVARRRKAASAG